MDYEGIGETCQISMAENEWTSSSGPYLYSNYKFCNISKFKLVTVLNFIRSVTDFLSVILYSDYRRFSSRPLFSTALKLFEHLFAPTSFRLFFFP